MKPRKDVEGVRDYYERILPFYELEAISRAHLAFWRGVARALEPREILEVGAGLGRITSALAKLAPATGLDVSLDLLARAVWLQRGHPVKARFVAADMRTVVCARRFDLIVAPSDPISHLTTLSDRRRALSAIAAQLSPDGRFVLEALVRRRREFELPPRRIRHSGGVLRIDESWYPVGVRDLWHARYRYLDRGPGRPDRELSASFVARAWDPRTVRARFAECGLEIENLWGDFDHRPFRRGDSRLIVVARRLSAAGRGRPAAAASSSSRRRARSSR